MTDPALDTYLARLARELRIRGVPADSIVDEARDHILSAIEAATAAGTPGREAIDATLARFGAAPEVAAAHVHAAAHVFHPLLLASGAGLGLAIAWIDSRPTWDDAGITAFALLLAAAVLTLIQPQRPWRWALAVGIWVPLYLMVRHPTIANMAGGLVILGFPLAGAYGARLLRLALAHT